MRKPNKRGANAHYVNNDEMLAAMKAYHQKCREAEAAGKPVPIIPNFIGECFLKMARRIGSAGNFSSYTFREDMEGDAVINCLSAVKNFDSENRDKPFAYFTTVITNSFLERIAKEKANLYIIYKSSRELVTFGDTYDDGSGEPISLNLNVSAEYIDDYIRDYEEKMQFKRDRTREKSQERSRAVKEAKEKNYMTTNWLNDDEEVEQDIISVLEEAEATSEE